MRIFFMGNNWLGWKVLSWLRDNGEEVVGLSIHPERKRTYGTEIVKSANLALDRIISGDRINDAEAINTIKKIQPDIGVCILFDYILKEELLSSFPGAVVNLHPSYLPYNRGQYPNVWSIVEGTPSGATLHYIDTGIDTGDIIAQCQTPVEPIDTGETLYRKLEQDALRLFQEYWPRIKVGDVERKKQANGAGGTYHRSRDVDSIDLIDMDKSYNARTLVNILRARSFPPHEGAYFVENGRKVFMELRLKYGNEIDERY